MFAVFSPSEAAGQFHIVQNIVISLTKARIGIEHIGILAKEIVVPCVVDVVREFGSIE